MKGRQEASTPSGTDIMLRRGLHRVAQELAMAKTATLIDFLRILAFSFASLASLLLILVQSSAL
jgi:hypothetical protein